jgi:hypothetical protein
VPMAATIINPAMPASQSRQWTRLPSPQPDNTVPR